MERVFVNVQSYGNTSAASVPLALSEAVAAGRVKKGDKLLLVAFGAGLTSAAITLQWTADPAAAERAKGIGPGRRDDRARLPGRGQPLPARARVDTRADGITSTRNFPAPSRPVPAPRTMRRSTNARSDRQDRPRHRRRPWYRQGDLPDAWPARAADIAFVDVGRQEVADATVAEIEALGRKALYIPADVTDPEACDKAVKAVIEAYGKLDILVNNAGITRDDLIMRMPIDDWKKVLEVNLFGAFYMTKAAIRPMLKARGGRIINMSSVSGQAGQMGQANYSSSKAGLIGLTKATAREVGSRGITCNAVAPGIDHNRSHHGAAGSAEGTDRGRHAAGPLRHRGGHRQRGHVPGLRRGGLHHRPGSRRRRRPGDAVVALRDG